MRFFVPFAPLFKAFDVQSGPKLLELLKLALKFESKENVTPHHIRAWIEI